jgi:hypothetical protein
MRELAVDKAPAMEQLQAALLELIQVLNPDVNLGFVSSSITASQSITLDIQPPKTNPEQEWLVYYVQFRITGAPDAGDSVELRWRDELISGHIILGYSLQSDFVDGRFVWPQNLPAKSTQLNSGILFNPLIAKLKGTGETWKRPVASFTASAVVGTRNVEAAFLYAARNRLFD